MSRKQAQFRFEAVPTPALPVIAAAVAPAVASGAVRFSLRGPRLSAHDEAIFLLHTVAEVEHALMVQYLYAAYSLAPDNDGLTPEQQQAVRDWQATILEIAREEMGHLVSVQNLLQLIGGPLNFEREDFPFRSDLYPFMFHLQPLTRRSLAKYVAAERPAQIAKPEDEELFRTVIEPLAREENDEVPVNRVGALFERLRLLFGDPQVGNPDNEPILTETDFRPEAIGLLARVGDWGYRTDQVNEQVLVEPALSPSRSPMHVLLQQGGIAALRAIAAQGEGYSSPALGRSHYDRFLEIFKQHRQLFAHLGDDDAGGSGKPTQPVPIDPTTSSDDGPSAIKYPRARLWAQLFNLRYRMILGYLEHFFATTGDLYTTSPPAATGDRTNRGFLLLWVFDEMRRVRKIARKLVQMPRNDPVVPERAGPPFELPYSLRLPESAADRWRTHRDVLEAAVQLVSRQLQPAEITDLGSADPFLASLLDSDRKAMDTINQILNGTLPLQPTEFLKICTMLEEAVRGFDVNCFHTSFWANIAKDEFVAGPAPIGPIIDPAFNPESSRLIQVLRSGFMPARRPSLPDTRLGFIREWITNQCPDNSPGGQRFTREPDIRLEPIGGGAPGPVALTPEATMLKLIDFLINQNAPLFHGGVGIGNGETLESLFNDRPRLLDYLTKVTVVNDGVEQGKKLIIPKEPQGSAFFRIIQRTGHPMKARFAQKVPDTRPTPDADDLTGVQIVEAWINSLPTSAVSPDGAAALARIGAVRSSPVQNAMVNLLRSKRNLARFVHGTVQTGGGPLNALFTNEQYDAILNFLQTTIAVRDPVAGQRLIVPKNPTASALYIQITQGVMAGQFTLEEIRIVEDWINSLSSAVE